MPYNLHFVWRKRVDARQNRIWVVEREEFALNVYESPTVGWAADVYLYGEDGHYDVLTRGSFDSKVEAQSWAEGQALDH